ncbi:hypothetical protein Gotur_023041 [Gossypium turneri]
MIVFCSVSSNEFFVLDCKWEFFVVYN